MALIVVHAGGLRASSADDVEIGGPTLAGDTVYQNGTYIVSGAGVGVAGAADQLHFNGGVLSGDGTLSALVVSAGNSGNAQAGVMFRSSTASGDSEICLAITPTQGLFLSKRSATGAKAVSQRLKGIYPPVWLKLQRAGSVVTASYSMDNQKWKVFAGTTTTSFPTNVLAGVEVSSGSNSHLNTASFRSILTLPTVDNRYLHASGNQLRDRSGNLIVLRGVNLGGWLCTEGWMNGDSGQGDCFVLDTLTQRFGSTKASTLINAWRDHWITASDLDVIKNWNFNLVRVPFDWLVLQNPDGSWVKDTQGNIDFSRFDWIVQEAAKRGIYVIFDLHVWKGQKAGYSDICEWEGWTNYDDETMAAANLWSVLAMHFKEEGTVAAFDVINEPSGSNDDYLAHRAFYTAIRNQDPDRLLVMEWINVNDLPSLGWTNIMVSDHYCFDTRASSEAWIGTNYGVQGSDQATTTVFPCYIGEFKAADYTNSTYTNAFQVTQAMDQLGWAWSSWTYKGVNVGGWALCNYTSSFYYNRFTNSYDSLMSLWTNGLTRWTNSAFASDLSLQQELVDGLANGAVTKTPDLVSGKSYALLNYANGLTIDGGSGKNGTAPVMTSLNVAPGAGQVWQATLLTNGAWTFANASGVILNGFSSGNPATLLQSSNSGRASQQWSVISTGQETYRIVNLSSGLELTFPGNTNQQGTPVNMTYDQPGNASQHWTFDPMN